MSQEHIKTITQKQLFIEVNYQYKTKAINTIN